MTKTRKQPSVPLSTFLSFYKIDLLFDELAEPVDIKTPDDLQ